MGIIEFTGASHQYSRYLTHTHLYSNQQYSNNFEKRVEAYRPGLGTWWDAFERALSKPHWDGMSRGGNCSSHMLLFSQLLQRLD